MMPRENNLNSLREVRERMDCTPGCGGIRGGCVWCRSERKRLQDASATE
jgi:hypothetical protein